MSFNDVLISKRKLNTKSSSFFFFLKCMQPEKEKINYKMCIFKFHDLWKRLKCDFMPFHNNKKLLQKYYNSTRCRSLKMCSALIKIPLHFVIFIVVMHFNSCKTYILCKVINIQASTKKKTKKKSSSCNGSNEWNIPSIK